MFKKYAVLFTALALTISLGSNCGKTGEPSAPALPIYKPTGNEGSISGIVSFSGTVPAPRKMEMSQDPECGKMGEAFVNDVVVRDGKLQNVFVYVKSGLAQVSFEIPPEDVILDQKGCQYVPRVLGIQTGQGLKITNSDPTDHNVHPTPRINNEWNQSQMAGQGPLIRKFPKEEVLIQVKCNKHPWMLAWVGVLAHPFRAVSGPGGNFSIKGLPPGDYEIEAWHEKYGAKTMKVKVTEKADARADFTFDASMTYNAGSLRAQPALVIP